MYRAKTPGFVKLLYRDLVWNMPRNVNEVFLTFDDGPVPELTPFVLDTLKQFNAKATFFCIGANIEKYPELFERIKQEGHTVGNHTEHHLNGWQTSLVDYCADVTACNKRMQARLFRPPYGRITRRQAKQLRKDYSIIMWDVLSADFDQGISPEQCLNNVVRNTEKGSIVVFHDSIKAEKNLRYALPKALVFLKQAGFTFSKL